jgi:hypothetical protein
VMRRHAMVLAVIGVGLVLGASAARSAEGQHTGTEALRAHWLGCLEGVEAAQKPAREIELLEKKLGFSPRQARELRDQLRAAARSAAEHHDAFAASLDAGQLAKVRAFLDEVALIRTRLEEKLQALDAELAEKDPRPRKLAVAAGDIGKELKRWLKQCEKLGTPLGLSA